MVAVPKEERVLKHVSKPLMQQMKKLIDRTRWPSLVTYSDEGLGHTGYVYQCSGWTPTDRNLRPQYEDEEGRRSSTYRDGKHDLTGLRLVGQAWIQRWEHHIVEVEKSLEYMRGHGWERVAVPGKTWASGNPAYTIAKRVL